MPILVEILYKLLQFLKSTRCPSDPKSLFSCGNSTLIPLPDSIKIREIESNTIDSFFFLDEEFCEIGGVVDESRSFRVRLKLSGRGVKGPRRGNEQRALGDLKVVRAASARSANRAE